MANGGGNDTKTGQDQMKIQQYDMWFEFESRKNQQQQQQNDFIRFNDRQTQNLRRILNHFLAECVENLC